MRRIDHIVFHCTAGNQRNSAADIVAMHTAAPPRGNGWRRPGYHILVTADGVAHNLVPLDDIANGAKGFNAHAIHIAYTGGVALSRKGNGQWPPLDNRTPAQRATLISIAASLHARFPGARIVGHRDLNPAKSCPSFDAAKEYAAL